MPTRNTTPKGTPCWADLWTSDVAGARRFYAELFGWEAQAPDPAHGGYFMFTRAGVPIAGGMGDMGDMGDAKADNAWKVYLATDDMAKTLETARAEGAQVVVPATPVDDLGVQAVLVDPTGAPVGAWQPGSFRGFGAFEEPGAPSWFELGTRDHDRAVAFYRSVFGWSTSELSEPHEIAYTIVRDPAGTGDIAGVMDASRFLPEGSQPRWSVYWQVEDVEAAVAKVRSLGGSVAADPGPSPYGTIAEVADPAGAQFKLHSPNG